MQQKEEDAPTITITMLAMFYVFRIFFFFYGHRNKKAQASYLAYENGKIWLFCWIFWAYIFIFSLLFAFIAMQYYDLLAPVFSGEARAEEWVYEVEEVF